MTETSWQKRFDEFYTLPSNMIPGPQREKAIKAFITEVEAAAEERCFEKGRKQYTGFAHKDGWNAALATVEEKVSHAFENYSWPSSLREILLIIADLKKQS